MTAATTTDPTPLAVSIEDPVVALAPFEHDVRDQARESARLADLGPGAADLGAAIDAAEARVLARIDEVGSLRPDARLAVFRQPALAPVSNTLLTWAVLLSSLDDFYRDPRSGTVEDRPEQVTIGGNPATVQSTLTLNATVNGSVLIADLTVRTRTQVRDASGATLYTVDSTAKGHVEVHFCPDANGQAPVTISLTTTETYGTAAGGSGGGSSNDYSATAVVTVNDDARIANVDGSFEGQTSSQGPPAAGSTQPGPASTSRAGDNIANDGNGRRRSDVARDIQLAGDGTTTDQQVGLWAGTSLITESMILAAAREAEKLWRDGKCVELQLDHGDEDVQPDAIVKITAKVHHRVDGNDLDKPVVAKLDGVKTLDPTTRQPAPATVTYTAGPAENDVGRVTFNTTSNRGMAEKTIRFIVKPAAWNVTFEGTDTEKFGPVANHLDVTIEDLRITANGDALSGTGDLHLKGTVTSGACSGKLDQTAPITVTGTLVGTGPGSKLQVAFESTSPGGDVVHLRCRPGGGADIGAEGHAERVGETLLGIELPADGGTLAVTKSKAIGGILNVKVKGTFTVTRAAS